MIEQDSPSETQKIWERLKGAGPILFQFARNPIAGMQNLPDWDWTFLLICQAISAAAAGLLKGLLARDLIGAIAGLIFVPISNSLVCLILSGFFYYTFNLWLKIPANFQRLYLNLVFATLPALVLFAASSLFQPLILVGSAATGLLLVVGFVDNFGIDRRRSIRIVGSLYALFFIFWVINMISQHQSAREFKGQATPESLDILEKELNLDK